MEANNSNTGTLGYILEYSTGATTSAWAYFGDGSYLEKDHDDDCIRVDKGSPDKAQHVIFYAEMNPATGIVGTDPMIFCKDKKELDKELKKLLKRKDIAKESIRIFNLDGGIKKL